MPNMAPDRALAAAHGALARGTRFIQSHAARPDHAATADDLLTDVVRIRLVGNRLRELDRLLNVLAEEVACRLRPSGHDPRAFARLHNTANKLRTVRAMLGLASPDHERLRAVGRLRDRLHHCAARVHAAGLPDELSMPLQSPATGTAGPKRRAGHGGGVLTGPTLQRICSLYRSIGDELFLAIAQRAAGTGASA